MYCATPAVPRNVAPPVPRHGARPSPLARCSDSVAAMAEPAASAWPDGVSVIMPVLNEERHLSHAVTGILTQDWAGPLEIVLALGPSSDRTDEVARRLQAIDDRIVLVPNPSGRTPSALNAAIAASRHDVVIRVDGHAILPDGLHLDRRGDPGAHRVRTTWVVSCRPRGRPRSSRRWHEP